MRGFRPSQTLTTLCNGIDDLRAYELHAPVKQIQRSGGRSSVAAAAYRSASRLEDERTGLVHDYTKKQGVEHSRIYTPEGSPAWANDRAKLWNAAEAKENRSNSCTARELELAFPAEFNAMQRREAGDKICRELVRRYGCVVDISYHRPDNNGDDRNFHAHILFTTRGFDATTKDGWEKKKYRDLNKDPITIDGQKTTRGQQEILSLRTFTANELNRIAKRDRLQVKTEHLNFEERGVDREPTQHRGNTATQMERNGKVSYIEEENRKRQQRNSQRAMLHAQAAQQAAKMVQKTLSEQFSLKKAADMGTRHRIEREQLEKGLGENISLKNVTAEMSAIQSRLKATGIKRLVRDVFKITATDKESLAHLQRSLTDIQNQQNEQRRELGKAQRLEREKEQSQRQQPEQKIERDKAQQTRGSAGRSDSRGQKRTTDKPQPEPPPPREVIRITQNWAERTGQNKRALDEAFKNRKIDTSKMTLPEEEKPTQTVTPAPSKEKSQSWEQMSGQSKTNDNKPARSLTPNRSRTRKP